MYPIYALFQILIYKLTKSKILVINEASGLGDYIWVRSYFELIKNDTTYKDYKIIFIGIKRWENFARTFDSKNVDLFLFLRSPAKIPLGFKLIFKLFEFDIFLNFRAGYDIWNKLTSRVRAKIVLNEKINTDLTLFYSEKNNKTFSQLIPVPVDFEHTLPIKKINRKILSDPYSVIVLGGYTMGYFSPEQIASIAQRLSKYGNILLLGTRQDAHLYTNVEFSYKENSSKLLNGTNFTESELPAVVNGAMYIITPNTSIYHMALLLKKTCLCVSLRETSSLDLESDCALHIVSNNDKISLINVNTLLHKLEEMINWKMKN